MTKNMPSPDCKSNQNNTQEQRASKISVYSSSFCLLSNFPVPTSQQLNDRSRIITNLIDTSSKYYRKREQI